MQTVVVIPNWNGKETIGRTIDSLLAQTYTCEVVVVENGSTDGSSEYIKQNYPTITLLENERNLGFAGGVNTGIRHAIQHGASYIALLNNDAVADKNWLGKLVSVLDAERSAGIVTGKLLTADGKKLDSTGECVTHWGLPFPRGRGEPVSDRYDQDGDIFAATGGASLYRASVLRQIGLFDEDFFAYYEDVDLSFRAQLAGWKVRYAPAAIAYHQIGATSGKLKGFTTYQTLKNLPLLFFKNVPLRLMLRMLPRFELANILFFVSALARGQVWSAVKGVVIGFCLLPKKLIERYSIQKRRTVSIDYIWDMTTRDLPPNAHRLRRLRAKYHKIFSH